MRALVAVESMFGNTERIASAIAEGLSEGASVDVVTPDEISNTDLRGIDLLVVGAPTHAHGIPRRQSREQAREMDGYVGHAPEIGIREFLDDLIQADGVRAAAFDTRMPQPIVLTGSAARGIYRRLAKHGFDMASPPMSFIVEHSGGPLRDGELERAKRWGTGLIASSGTAEVA